MTTTTTYRAPTTSAKKRDTSNDVWLQLFSSHGDELVRFPTDYIMKTDNDVESQYIDYFTKLPMSEFPTIPMVVYYNDVSNGPKAKTHRDFLVGMDYVDADGNVAHLSGEELTVLRKAAKAQIHTADDVIGIKEQERTEKWGKKLGWINFFFVLKTEDGKYELKSVPRATGLRAGIPGHATTHNRLIQLGEYGKVVRGRIAYNDPSKNTHLSAVSSSRAFAEVKTTL